MIPTAPIEHRFVETIPRALEPGVLYVSMGYRTAVHRCCCGCGNPVVTPISPEDWSLTFDGEIVSLRPSIGNWGFPCSSHYWITSGRVRWVADSGTGRGRPEIDLPDARSPAGTGWLRRAWDWLCRHVARS